MKTDHNGLPVVEAEDLSPYNAEATCPKCGSDQVATRYRPDYVSDFDTDFDWCYRSCCPRFEHHHRSCQRCGMAWVEAVLSG